MNTFLNFANSGWLDMGMVGFFWLGLAFYERSRTCLSRAWPWQMLASFFFACSFLAKGLAAMALLPMALFIAWESRSLRTLVVMLVGFVLPIGLFTALHYHDTGFLFWEAYWSRRQINASEMSVVYGQVTNPFWYFKRLLQAAHLFYLLVLVTLILQLMRVLKRFFLPFETAPLREGLRSLDQIKLKWPRDHTGFFFFLVGTVVLHGGVYGSTTQEYPQYLLPALPFVALSAGLVLSQLVSGVDWVKVWSQRVLMLLATVYVCLSLAPIQIHWGADNAYYVLKDQVGSLDGLNKVRVMAIPGHQHSWEGHASFVVWYWKKQPVLKEPTELFVDLQLDEGVVIEQKDWPQETKGWLPCYRQRDIVLFLSPSLCSNPLSGVM